MFEIRFLISLYILESNTVMQQTDLQQQSFGQLPRGAVNRIEGPLITNKNEKQALLTM